MDIKKICFSISLYICFIYIHKLIILKIINVQTLNFLTVTLLKITSFLSLEEVQAYHWMKI
jgi:hypothetical protein